MFFFCRFDSFRPVVLCRFLLSFFCFLGKDCVTLPFGMVGGLSGGNLNYWVLIGIFNSGKGGSWEGNCSVFSLKGKLQYKGLKWPILRS